MRDGFISCANGEKVLMQGREGEQAEKMMRNTQETACVLRMTH